MNNIWYKKLGFYANPLSIKPGMYDTDLIAYDLSLIFKKIDNGEMVFIEGDYGTGKTTILKNIISQYKGKNRIIYYSFNIADSSFDINSLLYGAKTFMKKLIGLSEKNIILLLDEVHLIKVSEAKSLLKPYKEGIIKSIVFVTHDYDLVTLSEEFHKLLKKNIIKTVELSSKEAIYLIRKRIGDLKIIDDKYINRIYQIANKNPRRLLEYCEDVLKFTIELEDDKVTDYHINEVLKDAIKEKEKLKILQKKEKIEKQAQLKKIVNNKILENKIDLKNEETEKNEVENKEILVEVNKNSVNDEGIAIEKKVKIDEKKEKDYKEKKFKVNKLIPEGNKNSLGAISEDENKKEKSEYKIYYINE